MYKVNIFNLNTAIYFPKNINFLKNIYILFKKYTLVTKQCLKKITT